MVFLETKPVEPLHSIQSRCRAQINNKAVRPRAALRGERSMKPSILVADDEPSILLSLQFLLQKAGFEVRIAHTGEEVIEQVAQSVPSLILLDAMMPKRDGFDVCQSIRADPAL